LQNSTHFKKEQIILSPCPVETINKKTKEKYLGNFLSIRKKGAQKKGAKVFLKMRR
jgi:hypothetical protein